MSVLQQIRPFSGMGIDGSLTRANDRSGTMRAGIETIGAQRSANNAARWNSPVMSGVLPDSQWDGFFGALQNRSRLIQSAGGKSRINVNSIGRTKARDEITGQSYDVQGGEMPPGYMGRRAPVPGQLNPSSRDFSQVAVAGLQRAMGR